MRILHLGGNDLGDRILAWLQEREDHVDTANDLDAARSLLPAGYVWIVSAGFRHIVPEDLLQQVPHACNVHTSLLPWGRGAHPNVWAIVDREPAGVSVHAMTAGVDRGPLYAQQEVEVSYADVASDLHTRLQDTAYELFTAAWPMMRDGTLQPSPQPEGGSYHRARDLQELADVDLDESVTWRQALDTLRALTFPPHQNFIVQHDGARYHVEVSIKAIDDE